MKPILAIGALLPTLFFCLAPALAEVGAPAAPSVAFPQVTAVPIPLQSASGRFSSLNPPNQLDCPYKEVTGHVVSPRLIMVKEMNCGRPGHDNVLVNVRTQQSRRSRANGHWKARYHNGEVQKRGGGPRSPFFCRVSDRGESRACGGRSARSLCTIGLYELYDVPGTGAGRACHLAWQGAVCAEHDRGQSQGNRSGAGNGRPHACEGGTREYGVWRS